MRWKLLVIFFLILFIVVQTSKSDEDKVDDIIFNVLENNSEVPVIVKLKENTGEIVTTEVQTSEVVEDLGDDFEKKNEYGNVFTGFSGNVTEEQLEALKNDQRVERIYFDYPVRALTINTTNTLNTSVMNAKSIYGVNITGKDQTVCVVDTGADYNNLSLGGAFGAGNKVLAGYDTVNNDGDPMDDNGHGSHIAGIIAGSGQIKGMAPGASIVAFKALNSGGEGTTSDVVEGIDWCIGNSTTYNITVISLSLALLNGSTEAKFNTHCDGNDAVVNAANSARERNISVVAAAGNDGSTAGVASPACGSNVTAVSSVNKQDSPSGYNSGALTSFWAPGENIYSVSSSGSSGCADGFCSGTSMAAPHVAGIMTLLLQYKKFENGSNLKPLQVIEALNKSGVNITRSGVVRVRVDAYDAVRFLDIKPPFVDINISTLDAYFNTTNMTINFSAIDPFLDYSLINVTYPNGTQWFNSTLNVTIPFSNLTINGNYTVTLFSNDSNNNKNLSVKSFRIITPAVALEYPTKFVNSSDNDATINCSVKSQFDLVNLSIYHNFNGTFLFNQTVNLTGRNNFTNFIFNNLSDGRYDYNCISSDDSNNTVFSASNHTFTIDTTNPGVELLSPANASTQTSSSITFSFNGTDNFNITSCSFIFDGNNDQTNTTITQSISQSFVKSSISNGEHTWAVSCLDIVSNSNVSATRNLTVSVPSGGGSPGGGGSGGGGGGGGSKKASSSIAASESDDKADDVITTPKIEERVYDEEVRSEDLSKLIEEVANLKKGLEILFSEVNSIKESLREPSPQELNTNRRIESSSGKSTLSLNVKFSGEKKVEDFIIYDEIPKNFAEDSNLITVNAEGAKVTIVERDPVYMFSYKNVNPGSEYNVEYTINKEVNTEVINEFRRPIVLVKDVDENIQAEQVKEEKTDFKKYLFIGGGILVIILIILGVVLYKVERIEKKEGLR
ncbi:S8 family serine peptidase [Candidatus Woesearchaeota archaeon]|nr:S8 family serine peptidase [Candidatus Woesearchaeota archaeon]